MSNIEISGHDFSEVDGIALTLSGCSNVLVRGCDFTSCRTAILAQNSVGITIEYNRATNLVGPAGVHSGNFTQFANTTGKIRWNVVDNFPGASDPEDIVNIFSSHATSDNPIIIENNWFRGGGPSRTGSGVLVGDGSGDWIVVRNNVLIDTGAVGVGVAGGSYISVNENTIYSDTAHEWSNVGMYFWNQSASPSGNNSAHGNTVRWRNAAGALSSAWTSGNMGTIDGLWTDNTMNATLDPEALWASRPDVLSLARP